jgi:hypothetical protein
VNRTSALCGGASHTVNAMGCVSRHGYLAIARPAWSMPSRCASRLPADPAAAVMPSTRGCQRGGRPRPVKQQVSRPRPRPPAEASHARQSARSISRLLSPRARLGQDLTICSIGPSRHPVNSFQQCQIRENLALCRFLLPHFRVLSCGAADRIPPVAGHTTKPWLLVARKD